MISGILGVRVRWLVIEERIHETEARIPNPIIFISLSKAVN